MDYSPRENPRRKLSRTDGLAIPRISRPSQLIMRTPLLSVVLPRHPWATAVWLVRTVDDDGIQRTRNQFASNELHLTLHGKKGRTGTLVPFDFHAEHRQIRV